MAWLLRDGEVLAALEVARTFPARTRGLLGRPGLDGALLLHRVRSVHTLGMRFAIDVAFCTAGLEVLEVVTLRPGRVTRPRMRARSVLEAEAGAFERWRLGPGDVLEVQE